MNAPVDYKLLKRALPQAMLDALQARFDKRLGAMSRRLMCRRLMRWYFVNRLTMWRLR
jgi:hypothetical protein